MTKKEFEKRFYQLIEQYDQNPKTTKDLHTILGDAFVLSIVKTLWGNNCYVKEEDAMRLLQRCNKIFYNKCYSLYKKGVEKIKNGK